MWKIGVRGVERGNGVNCTWTTIEKKEKNYMKNKCVSEFISELENTEWLGWPG